MIIDESIFASADLCVVGNLNRDVKTAPFPPGQYLFEDGETSVASIVETIGGGGANSAAAATALGARVSLVSKVGDDPLGHRLEETLRRHGTVPRLCKAPGLATGTSINLTYSHGRRHFVSCLANNESLRFEDLPLEALAGHTHLYRADIWFSEPMLYGGNQRLLEHARAAGMRISIDLNWDPKWGVASEDEIRRRKAAVREVLPLVHLAHGNVKELNAFCDSADLPTSLERLARWGLETVVVHLGDQGAGYYAEGRLTVEGPVPARQRVHATGTGDVLSVCMMLLDRRGEIPVPDRLRLANTVVSQFIEGSRRMVPELG